MASRIQVERAGPMYVITYDTDQGSSRQIARDDGTLTRIHGWSVTGGHNPNADYSQFALDETAAATTTGNTSAVPLNRGDLWIGTDANQWNLGTLSSTRSAVDRYRVNGDAFHVQRWYLPGREFITLEPCLWFQTQQGDATVDLCMTLYYSNV